LHKQHWNDSVVLQELTGAFQKKRNEL
jgi:hypothetical protein